jgi:hypothetical protein
MATQRSRFLRTVMRAERAIGAPVEAAIGRGEGVDVLLAVNKLSRRGLSAAGWVRGSAVHLFGLPTRGDARSLMAAIARLDAAVEELTARVTEMDERS